MIDDLMDELEQLKALVKQMGGSAKGCAVSVSSPEALVRIIEQPEIKTRLEAVVGGEVRGGTPEDMRTLLADQVTRWTRVVRDAKIKAD